MRGRRLRQPLEAPDPFAAQRKGTADPHLRALPRASAV